MANKVQIGQGYITIGGKAGAFYKTLGNIRKRFFNTFDAMDKAGRKLFKTGLALQAPLVLATQRFAALGDTIAKGAKRTGLSTKAYSELGHVAVLSGAEVEQLEKAIKAMEQGVFDASLGTGELRLALDTLGLTYADLAGQEPEKQFLLLAEAISKVEDPSIRAGAAIKAFGGRAGFKLIPMLNLGAEGIKHYREEAERLGISIGPKLAEQAERLTDMYARMAAATQGLTIAVGSLTGDAYEKLLLVSTNLLVNFRRYLETNPKLVKAFQDISFAALGLGAAMIGIGKAGKTLSALISPGGILLAAGAAALYFSGALDGVIEKWRDTVLAFEVGGKTIREWAVAAGEAWARLSPIFKSAGEVIRKTWDSIWVQIRTVWHAGLLTISSGVGAMIATFSWAWGEVSIGFLKMLGTITGELSIFFAALGDGFRTIGKEAWDPITRFISSGMTRQADILSAAFTDAHLAVWRKIPEAKIGQLVESLKMGEAWSQFAQNAAQAWSVIGNVALGQIDIMGVEWDKFFKTVSGTLGIISDILAELFPSLVQPFVEVGDKSKKPDKPPPTPPPPLPAVVARAFGTFSGREAQGRFGAESVQKNQLSALRSAVTLLTSIDSRLLQQQTGYGAG